MQKGLATILIVLILTGAIALAGGAYYLGTKRSETQQKKVDRQPQSSTFNSTISPNIPTDCNDQGNDFSQRSDFRKGEILVGFNKDVTLSEAQKVIQDSSLEIKDTDSFNYLQLLSVKVPQGEESKWICMLQKNQLVKYAELNTIIKIPDCSKDPC